MREKRGVWVELKGIHTVRKRLADGSVRVHRYAWRGGPPLLVELPGGETRAAETDAELLTAYREAHAERAKRAEQAPEGRTFADLVARFRNSTEHKGRAKAWRKESEAIQDVLLAEFGEDDIAIFEDKRTRRDIKRLRDDHAETPRKADKLVSELRTVLSWAEDAGEIGPHVARRISKLYAADRSSIIWQDDDLARILKALGSAEARDVVRLAVSTGLDGVDLLKLRWREVQAWEVATSRQKTGHLADVPLLPEARAVLDAIRARRPDAKPDDFVLVSTRGAPYTTDGYRAVFRRAKQKARITGLTFKDLRGTAATRFITQSSPQLSYAEVGAILGWSETDVERIARRYINRSALAKAAAQRLAGGQSGKPIVNRGIPTDADPTTEKKNA